MLESTESGLAAWAEATGGLLRPRGKHGPEVRVLLRPPVSLGFVIWIVIGLVVASNKGFLSHLDSLSGVLSAVLAVLAWPLVLLEVHVAI